MAACCKLRPRHLVTRRTRRSNVHLEVLSTLDIAHVRIPVPIDMIHRRTKTVRADVGHLETLAHRDASANAGANGILTGSDLLASIQVQVQDRRVLDCCESRGGRECPRDKPLVGRLDQLHEIIELGIFCTRNRIAPQDVRSTALLQISIDTLLQQGIVRALGQSRQRALGQSRQRACGRDQLIISGPKIRAQFFHHAWFIDRQQLVELEQLVDFVLIECLVARATPDGNIVTRRRRMSRVLLQKQVRNEVLI